MANRKEKQEKQLQKEAKAIKLVEVLKQSKKVHKKRIDVLKEIAEGTTDAGNSIQMHPMYKSLTYPDQQFLVTFTRKKMDNKNSFWDFINFLDKKSSLTERLPLECLLNIFEFKLYWIKDYSSWQFKGANANKQLYSLVNHLFSKHPLPKFTTKVWEQSNSAFGSKTNKDLDWFFYMAEGKISGPPKVYPLSSVPKWRMPFYSPQRNILLSKPYCSGNLLR